MNPHPSRHPLAARALATAPLLALAGCALFHQTPPANQFLLDPMPPVARHGAASERPPHVRLVQVQPPLDSRDFVYRIAADQWETDPYNRFLVSTDEMLTRILREALGSQADGPPPADRNRPRLDCALTALHGDFTGPGPGRAVVEITATLLKPSGHTMETIPLGAFRSEAPLTDRSPQALVNAWNHALSLSLTRLMSELAGHHPSHP